MPTYTDFASNSLYRRHRHEDGMTKRLFQARGLRRDIDTNAFGTWFEAELTTLQIRSYWSSFSTVPTARSEGTSQTSVPSTWCCQCPKNVSSPTSIQSIAAPLPRLRHKTETDGHTGRQFQDDVLELCVVFDWNPSPRQPVIEVQVRLVTFPVTDHSVMEFSKFPTVRDRNILFDGRGTNLTQSHSLRYNGDISKFAVVSKKQPRFQRQSKSSEQNLRDIPFLPSLAWSSYTSSPDTAPPFRHHAITPPPNRPSFFPCRSGKS